ncbi:hypothetical protein [Pseudofulvibacter geojedonensis]|uniref:Uncharacterized protein n=1 Tax=Pseudofulvibacter geojedonensis TaxID=1123758 RepID=A0ABW3I5D3_9FLAO
MKKLLSPRDSKQLFCCLLFLLVLFGSYKGIAQSNTYSDAFIENCIREVYKNKADEFVFNSNSKRLSVIKDLFNNRFKIDTYKQAYESKGLTKLSSVGLVNKYNSGLARDASFNPSTFNPLKYQLDIFPSNTVMYKVDNSNYVIIIKPSRNK